MPPELVTALLAALRAPDGAAVMERRAILQLRSRELSGMELLGSERPEHLEMPCVFPWQDTGIRAAWRHPKTLQTP